MFVSTVCVHLYSLALQAFAALGAPLLARMGKARELDVAERLRLPYPSRIFAGRSVVWLHAASLGEAKLLVRFMSILRRRHPDDLYVVTATSRAGVDYLTLCKNDAMCAIGFMPLDTVPLMTRMIDRFGIRRVWLMETELWPSMLWVCGRRGVPVGIANARLEKRSLTRYGLAGALFTPLLGGVDVVLAQDECYAERFEQLGVGRERIQVVGNIKSRVAIQRPARRRWAELRDQMRLAEGDIVVTAGCIHPGEAGRLREAIEGVARRKMAVKWIVVPRHLDKAGAILEELGPETLHIRDGRVPRTWRVCLVERYGVLEDMYSLADGAVLGGTFVPVGGHNVWEAAQFGIPVFFGFDFHTQKESCDRLIGAGVGFSVRTGDELAERIVRTMRSEAGAFIEAQQAFVESTREDLRVLEPLVP
jgi:3-deoxy-D-manno-octulosonic-acid transferase